MYELRLPSEPAVHGFGFPKTRKNELPIGMNHLSCGRIGNLALSRHIRDPVSLHDDEGIRNRRSSVAVDQGSTVDHQRSWLLRLSRSGAGSQPEKQSNTTREPVTECFCHGFF